MRIKRIITHKLIISYTSDLLVVHEVAVSGRTCPQPLSEIATVNVGCGEVPAMLTGRRRCSWGSYHLQTAHTSDHCDLWRCTAKHSALSGHSCSMQRHSYALPGTQSCAYSATQSPPCLCSLSQWCPWCGTVDHSVTKQHEGTLPGDVTARYRLGAGVPHRCSAPRECRWYQACTNRNDSRPC